MPDPKYDTQAKQNLSTKINELEETALRGLGDAYTKYVEKLKELNTLTEGQYKKDDFGLKKEFTPDDLKKFKTVYKDCAVLGERLIASLLESKTPINLELIENIQNMLSQDLKVLNDVKESDLENGTLSLQQIVDNARIKTIDITGQDLVNAGMAMSSRLPFKYIGPDGKEIAGVFTPRQDFDIEAMYDKFVEDLNQDSPYMASVLTEYKKAAIEYEKQRLKAKNRNVNAITDGEKLYKHMDYVNNFGAYTPSGVYNSIIKMLPSKGQEFKTFIENPVNKGQLDIFAKKCGKLKNSICVNLEGAQISDKSRIDSRNAAMSSVAELLGVSHVICKAIPMKLVKDGKEIEGTFMAMAEGVDTCSPDKKYTDKAYEYNGSAFTDSDGYLDTSALQIVDTICGNTDRHAGNIFYKFSSPDDNPEHDKFTGVQGIDNDTSFGTYVPTCNDEITGTHFICFDNLKVISNSMYKKVMSLDKEMLKFTLREHGLTEPQIKAAGQRLDLLRKYIQSSVEKYNNLSPILKKQYEKSDSVIPGTVRVVNDEDFKKLDLLKLSDCTGSDRSNTNSFYMVACFRTRCQKRVGEAPILNPKIIKEEQLYVLGQDETNWASSIVTNLSNVTSSYRTSDKFKDVQAAANRYQKFCEINNGAVLSKDLKSIRRKYLEDLYITANAYLENKKSVKKPSEYTQHRIDAVKAIYKAAETKLLDKTRYADGKMLNEHADRALDEFNAKMRKMALEIKKNNPQAEKKTEKAGENIGPEV